MTDPTDRLRLVQWLSPAFPIGSFAYSQGLETAITARTVHDPQTLQDWITAILTMGSARTDAILLAHARTGEDLTDCALALAPTKERHTEMMDQGRAFAAALTAITGTPHPPKPYALAIAHATRDLTVTTTEVLTHFLQGTAAQLTSVGVRAVPLGQTEGQRILATLAPLITKLADEYATAPLTDIGTATFAADLASMQHET
ncbi:MAG: urease accessory protein UreF, partial [Paracoccaceae bacterium]